MKRKHAKIGQQRHKPFPVVQARFSLAEQGFLCNIDQQPALFGVSFYFPVEEALNLQQIFSKKEAQEITWERAYRTQKSGIDEESSRYPICTYCALKQIANFLGKPEDECIYLIVGVTTTGKSILLVDRNLSRDRTDPVAVVGNFDSLEDFRRQYWEALEV